MLPDIEVVSAAVHAAWMDSKRAQGVTTRKAEDGEELMAPYEQLSEKAKQLDRGTVQAVYAAINASASETQPPITDNDRRWRFLEHGCQWVSFTPIGGDTRSFDPRILSGYAGHLQDMRATVDRETEKHLAMLKEAINAAKR